MCRAAIIYGIIYITYDFYHFLFVLHTIFFSNVWNHFSSIIHLAFNSQFKGNFSLLKKERLIGLYCLSVSDKLRCTLTQHRILSCYIFLISSYCFVIKIVRDSSQFPLPFCCSFRRPYYLYSLSSSLAVFFFRQLFSFRPLPGRASLLIFTQSPSSFRLLPLSPFYKRMHARVARRAERLLILAPFPRGDCNLRFKYEVRLGHPRGGTYLPLASA